MSFKRALIAACLAAAVLALNPASAATETKKKPAAVKKAPAKSASKSAVTSTAKPRPRPAKLKVTAPAVAEKPEVLSPDTLLGKTFDRVGTSARLSSSDAARYERIFSLQDVGNFKKANLTVSKLDDHRLMGHVIYQRFASPHYKATFAELAEWMKRYADHPGAQKIYDMAQRRAPKKGAPPLAPPQPGRGLVGYHDYDSGQLAQPYLRDQKITPREKDLIAFVNDRVSENPSAARARLDSADARTLLQDTKYDALQARVAEAYFYNNKLAEAYEVATASVGRSGKEVPLAGWVAGLAAWKKKNYEEAARHFENTATSPRSSAWMASAGAYWAARSYLRSRQPEKVSYWLQRAADHPRSFYGIIAVKALGLEHTRFNWDIPALTDERIAIIAELPAGRRALALMDADRPLYAEREVRQIDPGPDIAKQEAMMAFAHTVGAPAFEMRLGSGLEDKKGNLYDAALYPDPPWRPEGGYKLDRALVHAFIRQESRFDPLVTNKSSGAAGLMQLLPSTAATVNGGAKVTSEQLAEPSFNLKLGQKYLGILMRHESVKGNLFKLAVAYNAGPGNLARWEKATAYDSDPLLFIESIPAGETRVFVEKVMTNYWIYRLKYGQMPESLEKVASGEWPTYVEQDSHLREAVDGVKELLRH